MAALTGACSYDRRATERTAGTEGAPVTHAAESTGMSGRSTPKDAASRIKLTVYYCSGQSAKSAKWVDPVILVAREEAPFNLVIQNASGRPLALWRPSTLNGDACVSFEFKEPGLASAVRTARPDLEGDTLGKASFPATTVIAPWDQLILHVDFAKNWHLPFAVGAGAAKKVLMRAVYRSEAPPRGLAEEVAKVAAFPEALSAWREQLKDLWVGEVASAWEEVTFWGVPSSK